MSFEDLIGKYIDRDKAISIQKIKDDTNDL